MTDLQEAIQLLRSGELQDSAGNSVTFVQAADALERQVQAEKKRHLTIESTTSGVRINGQSFPRIYDVEAHSQLEGDSYVVKAHRHASIPPELRRQVESVLTDFNPGARILWTWVR